MTTENNSGSTIRAAELSDVTEIARLAGELGYPATAAEISARLPSLLGQPNHFIAVAVAKDDRQRLLGWIAAEERILLVALPQIEVMGLVVDQNARRQGIGHALIAAVEGWAKKRGRDVVIRSNTLRHESHPFYEGIGYHRKKSQHVYVKGASGV